jgi:hypothetical protein
MPSSHLYQLSAQAVNCQSKSPPLRREQRDVGLATSPLPARPILLGVGGRLEQNVEERLRVGMGEHATFVPSGARALRSIDSRDLLGEHRDDA